MKFENKKQQRTRKPKACCENLTETYDRHPIYPELRLSGKWLQDIGFNFGQPVIVLIEPNKITLTIEPDLKL